MFTGLIKDIGKIIKIIPNQEGKQFVIKTNFPAGEVKVDDSIATNGVCLTATKVEANCFYAQAVHVTLQKTSLGHLKVNDSVNLELALRPMDRMGGHFVQGHVNGLGKLIKITPQGKNIELSFTTHKDLFKYIVAEGSIAIDGISLTIAKCKQESFSVSIIPHTYENTNLASKKIGDLVNIEVDMMAKYLENFLNYDNSQERLKKLLDN